MNTVQEDAELNRRELIVGGAALGVASIASFALVAPTPKVADITIYGIKSQEVEMVMCTKPSESAAPIYDPQWTTDDARLLSFSLLWSAMQGLARCERVGILPIGFILSDRAYAGLGTLLSKGTSRYFLLSYPVVLRSDMGIDVHHTGKIQMETGQECIACKPGPATAGDWRAFQAAMLKHHAVVVSDAHLPKGL